MYTEYIIDDSGSTLTYFTAGSNFERLQGHWSSGLITVFEFLRSCFDQNNYMEGSGSATIK